MIETTANSSLVELEAQCMDMSERWFPETAHAMTHHALALAGEVGEFCNIVKKVERGSIELTEEVMVELAMEITDVLIYVLNIGAVLNVDLGVTYQLKQQYNESRFGAGSPDNSDNDARPDGDDNVPDGTSPFVPIGEVSKPL